MTNVEWVVSVIVALFIGGFLRSYLSKKGENLATHEDIEKLVEQMKMMTQATKEIEAKIEKQVWDQQRQWEMKKEGLFTLLKFIGHMDLLHRQIIGQKQLIKSHPTEAHLAEFRELSDQLKNLSFEIVHAIRVAQVVTSPEIREILNTAVRQVSQTATEPSTDSIPEDYDKKFAEMNLQVSEAIRKELGFR